MPIACARRLGLVGLRNARHVLETACRTDSPPARLSVTAVSEASRPCKRDPRRRESALQAAAHLIDLFAKIARDVPHLRNPIAVVLDAAIRAARRVAEIGPEGGVGIGGHLIVAKSLVGDQRFDLRAIHVVIQLLGRRELGARDRVELAQHLLPHAKPHRLGRRVDLRQMILNRLLRSLHCRGIADRAISTPRCKWPVDAHRPNSASTCSRTWPGPSCTVPSRRGNGASARGRCVRNRLARPCGHRIRSMILEANLVRGPIP